MITSSNWNAYAIRQLENQFIDHMAAYGYTLLHVPVIGEADLFLTRAGDKIIDRLFTFDRHGKLLALRPEFTAAAAQYYVQQRYEGVKRWQFSGVVFEDSPEQPNRQYQKRSIGAELIGLAGHMAEAEIVAMATHAIRKTSLTGWKIVSGHVGLQLHLLNRYNLDSRTYRLLLSQREALKNPAQGKDYALEQIEQMLSGYVERQDAPASIMQDDMPTRQMLDVLLDSTRYGTTMGGRTRHDIAHRLLQKRERGLEHDQILAALDFLADWLTISHPMGEAFARIETIIGDDEIAQKMLAEWQQTLMHLADYDIDPASVIVQPDLARNWEYYTGFVFGLRLDQNGEYIIGGGRYDELARVVGAVDNVPAVGFACYVDTLLTALDNPQKQRSSIAVSGVSAAKWAHQLRNAGLPVLLENENKPSANEAYITTVVILDDDVAVFDEQRFTWQQRDALTEQLRQQYK